MAGQEDNMIVRPAYQNEWDDAMAIAWRTFLRFEAPDYVEEGVQSFFNFITDTTLHKMFLSGVYRLFIAQVDRKMVGMITLRDEHHISLLFVDSAYHRRGIGSALIRYLNHYLVTERTVNKITVNSSPYGVEFYHKYGFVDLGPEMAGDGIRYTPMEFLL